MSILTCSRQFLSLTKPYDATFKRKFQSLKGLAWSFFFVVSLLFNRVKRFFVEPCLCSSLGCGRVFVTCEGGRSCMVGHVCLVKHKNLVDKVSSSESPRRTWKSNILSYSRVLTVDLMASNQLWWFTTLYVTYGWTKIYSLRLHHLLYFFSCDTQFTFTIWNKILRTCKGKFK